jgi:uncharacterized membrane protein
MEALFPGLAAAPNPHPVFVHFPIALWLTALLFWALAVLRRGDELWRVGRWLLYLGSLGALVSVASGLWAAGQLGHDSPGHDLVHVHRNWMLAASALGLATTVAAFVTRRSAIPGVRWLLSVLLVVTAVVLVLGADRGALLVFGDRLGSGVKVPAESSLDNRPDWDTPSSKHGSRAASESPTSELSPGPDPDGADIHESHTHEH